MHEIESSNRHLPLSVQSVQPAARFSFRRHVTRCIAAKLFLAATKLYAAVGLGLCSRACRCLALVHCRSALQQQAPMRRDHTQPPFDDNKSNNQSKCLSLK